MSAATMQFWFEFASTYSYLAAARVEDAARAAGVELEWRPFLLGPIFGAQRWNDSPFNIYPVKGRYMWRDMERRCDRYGLPFQKPSRFPRNGLLAARIACAGQAEPWCGDFVRAVYRANFADDREISESAVVAALLEGIGQASELLIAAAQTGENKDRLRKQTDAAISLGIFGAPTFVVGNELFWGNDRLEEALEWCVKGGGVS